MEHGAIKRLHGGRPRIRPDRLVGDKGFSAQWIRDYLARHGIHVTIPRKSNNKRGGPFDRQAYKMRNHVERLINRLKQFRSIATRYDKRADSYLSMWLIGAIILWL